MALRLRRDVQKASYYVWFLGAEEAKGLRGARVINSALPYLVDRARGQDPLKVTLQVSHKGIKILQGSSKHFIPHSAITSSVQTDDIVACVLLLYNPATKCPLHVHAYRCDSESTADALHQQLQILINRGENQKRFEELETRLGILPPIPTSESKTTSSHGYNEHRNSPKQQSYPSQQQKHQQQQQSKQQHQQRQRQETSPKRFNSSLGSDTGNSTRESECSEEHTGGNSPILHSPSNIKPLPVVQQNNELFDSLAAELRAKLNGNGPPLLLPPRDYDTVHRSKGNLAAIELRRCRNKLIVGGTPTPKSGAVAVESTSTKQVNKQVSSRGSSGIGSDLAPSPERQELNSSSDDDHWSNEADNSVIALKPSQIAMERSAPIIPHQPQLTRRTAAPPPEDSYLRDLPTKPYREKTPVLPNERPLRAKTSSSTASWSKEDEIKPIIMRPADYDAKFNRVLQTEQKPERRSVDAASKEHPKLRDTDKYNEINHLLNKKLSLERNLSDQRYSRKVPEDVDDFDDSDPSSDRDQPTLPEHSSYRQENLTDKQKFIEYASKRQSNSYAAEEVQRYGGRHRYVDPADLPFEQPQPSVAARNKYAAMHRGPQSLEEHIDNGHRTTERPKERRREVLETEDPRRHSRDRQLNIEREERGRARNSESERERDRDHERDRDRGYECEKDRGRDREREREKERTHYSRSRERNPYREPESIPYIQSMEKMMKSSAMRYKSFDGGIDEPRPKEELHSKLSQRSKAYSKREDEDIESNEERRYNYQRERPHAYAKSTSSNATSKERFRVLERSGSKHNLIDERDGIESKPRLRRGSIEAAENVRVYEDWSDEERLDHSPPSLPAKSRPRSKDRRLWESREREQHQRYDSPPPQSREQRNHQPRVNERPRDERRERDREQSRKVPREYGRDPREQGRRDYTPEPPPHAELHRSGYPSGRYVEKQSVPHLQPLAGDMYPPATPTPIGAGGGKALSNLNKGYRHSYAEPVFARSGGRVGLAAVNPF